MQQRKAFFLFCTFTQTRDDFSYFSMHTVGSPVIVLFCY
jgi:hypothetical protein